MQVIIKSFGIFLSWVSSGFLIYFFVTLSGSTDVRLNWYFVAIVLFIMFVVKQYLYTGIKENITGTKYSCYFNI